MDDLQRLLLLNQYEILSKLEPEDTDYQTYRYILANGYELLYSEVTEQLSKPMNTTDSQFVIDILQMYRSLTFSYDNLNEKEDVTEYDIAFKGFDGNEEGIFYSFAKFYLDDYNRFEELRGNANFDYNSHRNMIEKYSRMLKTWRIIDPSRYHFNLSIEEIRNIINA